MTNIRFVQQLCQWCDDFYMPAQEHEDVTKPICSLLPKDSENFQRPWDPCSPPPLHFAAPKDVNKPWVLDFTLTAYTHSQILSALLPLKKEWNSFCSQRARGGHVTQKSVKVSNYIRPGPQLMQSDRAPRNP